MVHTKILKCMYDWDGRKYIEFEGIGRVKVPFRYGRVMCKVMGDKTIQEMENGLAVDIIVELKTWDCVQYKVLYSIKEIDE